MDFLLSLVRRAIQSTGTKSAKVKGWRRKMVLLMCPSASRVLAPDWTVIRYWRSVVVQLLAREKKKKYFCFLTLGKTKITVFPENINRVTKNIYFKSWRETYIHVQGREVKWYENKKFQVYFSSSKDHRCCYIISEKNILRGIRFRLNFYFG